MFGRADAFQPGALRLVDIQRKEVWEPLVLGNHKSVGSFLLKGEKQGREPSFLEPVPLPVHASASLSYCLFTLSFGAYGNHLGDLQTLHHYVTSLIFFLLLWGWQGARQKRWTYPVAPAIRWRRCNSNAQRAKWDHLDHQCSVSTQECAMWRVVWVVLVAKLPNSMTFKLYQALACLGRGRPTIRIFNLLWKEPLVLGCRCLSLYVALVGLTQGRWSDREWTAGSLADLIGSGTTVPEKEHSSILQGKKQEP